jgi:hypothetical protein
MHGANMDIQQVLQFWFGQTINTATPSAQAKLWWSKQQAVDQKIREDFVDGLQALERGEYREWLHTASGRLAAIILLDQFSRNMYRDTPEAFAQDSLALRWCLEDLEKNVDLQLEPEERVFFICLWSILRISRCKTSAAANLPNYSTIILIPSQRQVTVLKKAFIAMRRAIGMLFKSLAGSPTGIKYWAEPILNLKKSISILPALASKCLKRPYNHQNDYGQQKYHWNLIEKAEINMGFFTAVFSQLFHMTKAHMVVAN